MTLQIDSTVMGNVCVTINAVHEIEIREFLDVAGRSPFARWFENLNAAAAARVAISLARLAQANFSNVEGVGAGVCELKIDLGPGYRVYFGKDGARIVILLGGSSKKRQSAAIATAQAAWAEYKRRRKGAQE
jgi:putative addiction module killer protein